MFCLIWKKSHSEGVGTFLIWAVCIMLKLNGEVKMQTNS